MADRKNAKKGKSGLLSTLVIPAVIMAVVGAGAGYGIGNFVLAPRMQAAKAATLATGAVEPEAENVEAGKVDSSHGAASPQAGGGQIVDLPPVTVNLVVPDNIWMRLQVAVETASAVDESTLNFIHQDIVAYVRQLRLDQLRSPNGYLRIRDDLARRARIRSEGAVSQLFVRTMVFE